MRVCVLAIGVLALLAGCSADWDQAPRHRNRLAQSHAIPSDPGTASDLPTRAPAEVAALPDRGNLMAYDKALQPVRRSAYTWHAVQLSEEHALRAVVDGSLVVTAPNGQSIRLQYERHVEHPDGNWTWIGRVPGAKPGTEAILTFGEKAVFGSIPYGDEAPLRLTTAAGRAWLMETDRAAIARMDTGATRPRQPDFLVPPSFDGPSTGTQSFGATGTAEAATVTAVTTVDVLIGYTSGFAIRLGGQSQAATRLTYLVDVTNQAYANSQIAAQVRLVRTMQVSYSDTTPNNTALYELTGVQCTEQSGGNLSCTYVGSPAALQPLHAARDEYGADLVSLVRNFNDPENGGCGVAWLNGAGQVNITADDASSGMSVIGDSNGMGPGSFPDNGYVCRDESFAHELGHNMGSAHDRNTSDGDDNVLQADEYGRFPYSFGYKTGAGAGNFYTVMAYGDSGQTSYRVFSNPATTFCGNHACGIANQADNARSLRQTMPIIAAFRPTAITTPKPRNDIDNDRKSELLWYHPTQKFTSWFMNGATYAGYRTQVVASGYTPLTTGDYNGDGRTDVLWRNSAGNLQMWLAGASSFAVTNMSVQYPSGWTSLGSGDVNGDGKSELLWYHPTQKMTYWIMNGATYAGYRTQLVASGYTPLTNGDYNGDQRLDLIWRNSAGNLQMWVSNGTTFTTQMLSVLYPAGWTSVGSGDVDGDRKADLLWYHPTHKLTYWIMNGPAYVRYRTQTSASDYVVLSSGDYNKDGKIDLFWKRSSGSGALMFWQGTGAAFGEQLSTSYPAGWLPVAGIQ